MTARSASRAPTIGVAVVGCGYWGTKLARNFAAQPDAQVIALCDTRLDRADRLAHEYRVGRRTEKVSEIFRAEDVDLVVVATPSASHYDLARRAIESGKHVLLTKPLTTRVDHAVELVELAERQGVMLAVDHTFVYTSAVQRIRDLILKGDLGELFYIDSVRANLGLFQSDVNVLWDLAPHDLSIVDYLLGGVQPTAVAAIGACHAGSQRENIAYVTLRYGDHVLAHVHVNWLAPAKVRRTIVGGSNRMVVYDDMEPSEKVKIYDKGVRIDVSARPEELTGPVVFYRSGDMLVPHLDEREALSVEAEHVLECLRTGTSPRADGEAGLRTVRVLEAAETSMREGSRLVPLTDRRAVVSAGSGA
jgi:predicted dehydrogenase